MENERKTEKIYNKAGNNFKWVDKIKYCAIILSI